MFKKNIYIYISEKNIFRIFLKILCRSVKKLDCEAEKIFRRQSRRKFFSGRKHNCGGPHGPLLGKSRGPWVPYWVKVGGPMGPRTRPWGAPHQNFDIEVQVT